MTSFYEELEKKLEDSNATPMSLPLQFLKAITCDFSTDSELGRGGFGVVYKGVLRSGKIIAVKKLLDIHLVDDKGFQNEVTSLMEMRHQHVVQLIGYCAESSWENIKQPSGEFIWAEIPKRLLCFEYVCNQSLGKYISDESSVLEWNMRFGIIKGICNGLNFLHEECRMVHLDLKPENILMDVKMKPKIADFGLSRIFGDQQSRIFTINSFGSRGYIAPEYLMQGLISKKADIFSLGVIIIEIITGRKDYPYFQQDSPQSTATSCQHFTDEVLGSWRCEFKFTEKCKSALYNQQVQESIAIALKCVDPVMEKRPTTKDIIQVLNIVDQVIPRFGALLDIYPLQLHFGFEPNKLIPCSLDLTNNTDKNVAFVLMEKSNDRSCFLCLPVSGIVAPRSTYILVVRMNKHIELPQDRNVNLILQTSVCDKLIHMGGDLCIKYFQKAEEELGKYVHKMTLKGVCALPGETIFEVISMEEHDFIYTIDANQAEPQIITSHLFGHVRIWNYDTQASYCKSMGSIEIPRGHAACSSRWVARKGWFLLGTVDGFINVFNYRKKMQNITSLKVCSGAVNSLAIHPTRPYVLSACPTGIKLWDWHNHWWKCMQTFEEHTKDVRAVAFNPEDYNSFASASNDGTIKVWSLDSTKSDYTLLGHSETVRCLDFFTCIDGQQYLISGSYDRTAKIWDMQKKECVRTLPHRSGVCCVLPHPTLPLLVTGTADGDVFLWSSTNFRLKRIFHIRGLSRVHGLACLMESGRVVVAHKKGVSVLEIRDDEEIVSSEGSAVNSKLATD
ncbi:hypothetical protein ACQ4PT_061720 [Festuca glaucescens]